MTHHNPTLGLVQINCRPGDKAANLEKAEYLLARIAGRARIACLPEMFDLGYDLKGVGSALFGLAEPVPGPTTNHLAELARRFELALIAGVTERDAKVAELIYDTTILLDRRGKLVARYRKSHLYPTEHGFFRPGSDLPVFEFEGLRVGIAICFEHAFPQIFSTLALRGAQLVVNPSAVPVGYSYLQDVRTRARAQDNQIFVAAVNHVGEEGEEVYCGGSQLADPRGEVVVKASETEEAVLEVELNLDLISEQRWQEPIFRSRRPELYEQ